MNSVTSLTSPTVSVIMNGLNCARYLREAIDSVFAQTFADWEIIFWDNASTDQTAEIAQAYGEKVRYFRSPQTAPLGRARNLAMKEARGRYLAFLDCDDVWLPEKLEKQVAVFESSSETGLVFCNAIYFNDRMAYRFFNKRKPPVGKIFRDLFAENFLPLPTVVMRKTVLEHLPQWFDERFNVAEDADLFMRIAHDYEIGYVDVPLVKYRLHDQSWTSKHKEIFAEELSFMIEKFRTLYPRFDSDYAAEIYRLRAVIAYLAALSLWEKGTASAARQQLRPFLVRVRKLWIPYFFSFFPYKIYVGGKNYYKKFIR